MLDLIKMDLYRMFKMKSLLITTVLYTLYAYLFTWGELAMIDNAFSTEFGVYVMMFSTLPLFFIALFSVLFITFDTHSGFIKSYVGQIPSRTHRLASKLICCLIYQLIAFAYIVVAQIVICALISGDVKLGNTEKMLKFLAILFLIQFAITCVIMMITTAFKSHVAPIVFAVCISLGVFQILTSALNLLFKFVFEKDFDPTKYLLTAKIEDVCDAFMIGESLDLSKTLLLVAVYIVVSIAASIAIFRKRDLS